MSSVDVENQDGLFDLFQQVRPDVVINAIGLIKQHAAANNPLSAAPINKYDLLTRVAKAYGKSIEIVPDDSLQIDRSLDSSKCQAVTGFVPKSWDKIILPQRNFA